MARAANGEEVTVRLSRPEALALLKVAREGLRINEALDLVKNTTLIERAINALSGAIGPR